MDDIKMSSCHSKALREKLEKRIDEVTAPCTWDPLLISVWHWLGEEKMDGYK